MVKVSKLTRMILILTLIAGCHTGEIMKSEKDQVLFDYIGHMQHQVENHEWREAIISMESFKKEYDKRKWKMQMLGELEDYQDIELEVEKFKVSARENDESECQLGLKQIEFRLSSIYEI
ncbi:DUF4363 family protein [Bacillus sp. A301a_S52]|jgi:hypothetical protein|nr:DUF4363 family protein [Bacillus sp. A301a_S52]